MAPNPLLGILLHAIGGFAAGSFYAPIKKVTGWAWESAWLVMGLAAWLACPGIASYLTTPELHAVIRESIHTQASAIGLAIMFGCLWGFGNLTYGMAARYLGIALGGSVALGFCMLFGTLVPPMLDGTISQLWETRSGWAISVGILLCALGIVLCGEAGRRRDLEQAAEPTEAGVEQFHFGKGMLVAIVAGILSACFAFGLAAGKPIADISVAKGTNPLYQNNVVLIAVLTGGFLTNALSCLVMNFQNRSFGDYVRFNGQYFRNLLLVWVAGVTWFCQFFFYGMGQTKLGEDYHFASWTIHMAFIVVFLNMWGLSFHEWHGTSQKTKSLVWIGILILIGSTVVIGVGNKLAVTGGTTPAAIDDAVLDDIEAPSTTPAGNSLKHQPRVGLFGIGLDAYWPQFDGLEQRLQGYLGQTEQKLAALGVDVVNLGLIDTPEKALVAGHDFRRSDVDLIFLHVTTYALSSTVLPVVRRAKVPVIILNLQPGAAIDYESFNKLGDRTKMTGEWLAYCAACPVPEIANVFNRARIPFHQITGMLGDDPECWNEVADWIAAARVAYAMEHNRLGVMGHYYGGMLDIYSDLTQQCAHFGGHVEMLEVDELARLRGDVTDPQIAERVTLFNQEFDVQADCSPEELQRAARTSVAMDRLVAEHDLGSLAYYYMGTGNPANEDAVSSIILANSLLTARGIPVAGELEIKNVQAMKILDNFGVGGSFTEYYAMDYHDNVVLMGHDGPGHIAVAQGKTKVRPLEVYHGKVGRGLSVEMSVKHGPVTLLSVVQTVDGQLMLLVAEAESVAGPILEIGNTNSRYRFPIGARKFVEAWNSYGPAHHCAVGVGHIAARIKKLGALLNMRVEQVC